MALVEATPVTLTVAVLIICFWLAYFFWQPGTRQQEPHVQRPHCANCRTVESGATKLKRCSQCQGAQYCSEACQQAHWAAHKRRCKYLAACRETTTHDVLILPVNGWPAHLSKLDFSTEHGMGSGHPRAAFLRGPDLVRLFGNDADSVYAEAAGVTKQEDPADDGEYIMYYSLSQSLRKNMFLQRLLGPETQREDVPFWRGDVVIVKFSPKFQQRPDYVGEGAECEVDFFDVKLSVLPAMQQWMRQYYPEGLKAMLQWQANQVEIANAPAGAAGSNVSNLVARRPSEPELD